MNERRKGEGIVKSRVMWREGNNIAIPGSAGKLAKTQHRYRFEGPWASGIVYVCACSVKDHL